MPEHNAAPEIPTRVRRTLKLRLNSPATGVRWPNAATGRSAALVFGVALAVGGAAQSLAQPSSAPARSAANATQREIGAMQAYADMLRGALGDLLAPDVRSFPEMIAVDGVVEFPFAPPGFSERLQGRQAVAAHMERVGPRIRLDGVSEPLVHRTSDPGVLIIEFEGVGQGVTTGEPYRQRYISVMRLRNGHIAHIKEYWNPLAILQTLKGPAAVEAFSADLGLAAPQ